MNKNSYVPREIRNLATFIICFIWFSSFANNTNSDADEPHSGIACGTCHTLDSQQEIKSNKCIGCHSDITTSLNFQNINVHNDLNKNCVDCHSFHDRKNLIVDNQKFSYDFSSESPDALCITCHQSTKPIDNLSDGHLEARKLYHSNQIAESALSPSQSCMVCHGVNFQNNDLDYSLEDMPVVNTHASHPYEINIIRGEGNSTNRIKFEINPEIYLFDNSIECQTCHILNEDNDNLLFSTENESIFCNGCHIHNDNIDLADAP